MHIEMPVKKINQIVENDQISGQEINFNILRDVGIFIIRNKLSKELIENYKKQYDLYKLSPEFDRTPSHLTEVNFKIDNPLSNLLYEIEFKNLIKNFFDGNVGVYNIRIVKKDREDVMPVFLHQDIGYQYGSFNRYSLFVPLTNCHKDNGGLTFIPGTHKFGFLGDAGEINEKIIPPSLVQLTPEIMPGDVVVMDSCLWHKSGPNLTGGERVYYDIHINSSQDPASKFVISGKDNSEYKFNYDQNILFNNSRVQRLKKLNELNVRSEQL